MLWVAYEDATGKRVCRTSGFRVGQEAHAREFLAELERQLEPAAVAPNGATIDDTKARSPGPSVRAYGDAWLKKRENRVATVGNEEGHLRNHVYPRIGDMSMRDVKPRHIRDLVLDLSQIMVPRRGKNGARMTRIAPRTVLRVYATLHRMFKSAVVDEVVDTNPVVVEKGILPKNIDKDPEWRATAVFDRDELISLIGDSRISMHHRVLNALKGLGALRHGEAAGLRWRDYHPDIRPLGKLVVSRSYDNERTKTKITREVPVHPVLAQLLDDWCRAGWAATFGREPTANDLIVPNHKLELWPAYDADDAFKEDLAAVGLRNRRGHDLRRTFITLAQVDGARRDLLKVITHGPAADDIINLYTTFPWPALCAEVAKLDVKLATAERPPVRAPSAPARSTITMARDVAPARIRDGERVSRQHVVNAPERCSATRSATCSSDNNSDNAELTPPEPLSNVFVNRRSPVQTRAAALNRSRALTSSEFALAIGADEAA
ncbi:MAG TPA: hypothetical protein VMJ10_37615 [Kofleriaceae bacterium]|nr:hypothetical protein [Kofleriaceae bacterium]